MDDSIVRAAPDEAVSRLCEDIRTLFAAWVPGLLGVHIRTRPSEFGPDAIALLLDTVEGAAACTVLPGDADTGRRELRTAVLHAAAAADGQPGADVRGDLVAARAGCRRAMVALGLPIALR
ncbi:hypothetical protein [Streptomyces sp. NPDC058304]|uniref:hypothetical protein n=1 Tax=Streptomyces sp. NPDC058304 TaxID=3346437 RepID=UPI0036E65C39